MKILLPFSHTWEKGLGDEGIFAKLRCTFARSIGAHLFHYEYSIMSSDRMQGVDRYISIFLFRFKYRSLFSRLTTLKLAFIPRTDDDKFRVTARSSPRISPPMPPQFQFGIRHDRPFNSVGDRPIIFQQKHRIENYYRRANSHQCRQR